MRKHYFLFLTLILGICLVGCKPSDKEPAYKNSNLPVEKRVNDLLSRMTLDEKILQLNQYATGPNDNPNNIGEVKRRLPSEIGSLIYRTEDPELRNKLQRSAVEETRLGIPIIFGYDVIHGFRTIFPIPLAQAMSWNPELVRQAASVAAKEAWYSGIDWTFAPMIDVARDGRWGRIAEGYGEDPYTTAVFTKAAVQGFQGEDMSADGKVAACLKHFAGYGACEGGRDYGYTEISRQTLWDTYLPPYEAGVKAGAATVMSAFTNISGVPATINKYLLTDILKEKWGHDGFIVSDWGAIGQLLNQGATADSMECAVKAFNAGLEMDMMSDCYGKFLKKAVEEKKVSMAQIDESVRRVLRLKFRKGLFEHPYTPITTVEERFLLPESKELAQKLAEETIVLLKNENQILPLSSKNLAVIGPMVKDNYDVMGCWTAHGNKADVETIWDGLQKEFAGQANLLYAQGCEIEKNDASGFAEALSVARRSDIVLLFLGESRWFTGEDANRSSIALPAIQQELLRKLKEVGKPIVLVLSSGRAVEIGTLEPLCDAIVEMWHPGTIAGTPIARVLSGKVNPSGKLALTFPYSGGQMPIYYNARPGGRPLQGKYTDIQTTPLYEFGHGLSYTTFEYGDLKASATDLKKSDKLTVTIDVKNTGDREGAEVVHWFVRDPVCSITRPMKELKHFEKQTLKPGETKTFTFEVDLLRDFGFVDGNGNRFLEAGEYQVIVKDKVLKVMVE